MLCGANVADCSPIWGWTTAKITCIDLFAPVKARALQQFRLSYQSAPCGLLERQPKLPRKANLPEVA